MRLLILIASLWALVAAKPEMYKEKEDFQYSRSSSDDGSKSGYYGAQRGNMGGNYERAHNMDSLAQHQMSTLVRNVDGELGEGANTRTGSVFAAANSRGLYGSGNYDLSNLKGRNFAEGTISGDSLSQAASSQNLGYSDYSGYGSSYSAANKYSSSRAQNSGLSSGYQSSGLASQYLQTDAQKAADNIYGARNYEYDSQGTNNYKYAQSNSQARSDYENSNIASGYDHKASSSLIHATPVRVYIRPGTRIAIPVAAQVYDASAVQGLNTVHSDSDTLGTTGQRIHYNPTNKAKHYESSYSYRKEWQKQDSIPVTIAPTESPIPMNSELYEDAQLSQTANNRYKSELASAANSHASSANSAYLSGYSASTKNALSSQSRHQSQTYNSGASALNAYNYGTSASNAFKPGASDSSAYSHNAYDASLAANQLSSHISDGTVNSNDLIEDISSRPKSYHSSYSYHKSWERRGDPYIIKPVGGEQTSQKLTAASAKQGYACVYCFDDSQQRVRRSINTGDNQQHDNFHDGNEDMGQQTMNAWEQEQDLDQQAESRWQNLADLGQQTQNKWEEFGSFNQQPQTQLGNLEDLGQQTQNQWDKLEDLGQQTQTQWGKLEDLSQQPQTPDKLEDLGQQTQSHWGKLEDLGQQTQNQWDKLRDLSQQTQTQDKLEDLGQQMQSHWGKLEDLGQQTQNQWDNLRDLSQQTQTQDKLEDLGQQMQSHWGKLEDLGQQTQNQWDNLRDLSQQTQTQDKLEDLGQQMQSHWGKLEDLDQKTQTQGTLEDLGQQTQNQWDNLGDLSQQTQSHWGKLEDLGQQTQTQWDKLEDLNQQTQSHWGKLEDLGQQTQNNWDNHEDLNQQAQNHWGKLDNSGQTTQNNWYIHENQQTQSHWGKLDDLDQQNKWNSLENVGQQSQNKWSNLHNLDQQENLGQVLPQNVATFGRETQNTANSFGGYQFYKPWTVDGRFVPYYTNYREINGLPYNVKESLDNINKEWNYHNLEHGSYFHHHNFDFTESQGETHNSHHSGKSKENTEQNSEDKPKIDTNFQIEITTVNYVTLDNKTPETTQKTINSDKVEEKNSTLANIHPIDIGRGDIGPEDISLETTNINEKNNYKTAEEIESLSLTKDQRDISNEPLNLSVTGLNQQSKPDNNFQKELSTVIESITTSTAKPKGNLENNNINAISTADDSTLKYNFLSSASNSAFNNKHNAPKQMSASVDQQDEKRILDNFEQHNWVQQTQSFDQQNIENNLGKSLELFKKHDMAQQFETFEEQNMGQYLVPLEEQQFKQQLGNFEHQNLEQQIQNFEQQNMEQYLEPFKEQNIEQLEKNQKILGRLQNSDEKNDRPLETPEEETARMNSYDGFGQQVSPDENIQQHLQSGSKQFETSPQKMYIQEQNIQYKSQNVELSKDHDDISTPIEPSTEKPGFWGTVWKKTKSAKDSLVSWFHS